MSEKIKKFFNVRIIIIIICIVAFILANSAQQKYVSLDDVPISTLITTSTTPPETTSTPPTTTTPTGPTFPTDTPTQPNGGVDIDKEPFIPTQIIPIVIAVLFAILIGLLVWRRRKEMQIAQEQIMYNRSVVRSRREKLVTKIRTLVEVLNDYLKQGKFTEGIIFGFHQLDGNMRRILGVKRDSHLTPKEFSNSLELPEVIPHLDWIIRIFYLARYKLAKMQYQDLEVFIQKLQKIKDLSDSKSDIEIIQKDQLSDKK